MNTAITGLALLDIWYFRFYGDVPSVAAWKDTRQFRKVLPSVTALIRPADFALLLDIAVGLILCLFLRTSGSERNWNRNFLAAVALLLAGLIASIPAIRLIATDTDQVFECIFQRREIVKSIGLLPYHVYDTLAYLAYSFWGRWIVSDEDCALVEGVLSQRRRPAVDAPHFGLARGNNIILISAESLQGFVLGLEVDGRSVTPHLNAFAEECIRFPRFYDQTHSSTTADAEFLALQSLYPLAHGAAATRYPAHDFRALPTVLAEQGYVTVSACAESSDFWNMSQFHPKLGFQKSWFLPDYHEDEIIGLGLADEAFLLQTASRLGQLGRPFLAYLITTSAHHPYAMADKHRTFNPGRFSGTIIGDYLQAVHYFDQAFGKFVNSLQEKGLLERSLLVLFGDHQAHLSEEPELPGLLASNGRLPKGTRSLGPFDQWRVANDVPFLMRLPGGASAGVFPALAGHLDIAPTVLSLAGLEDDLGGVMLGRDLLGSDPCPVVFRDGSVATETSVFVRDLEQEFDLTTGRATDRDRSHFAAIAAREFRVSDTIVQGNLVSKFLKTAPPLRNPPLKSRPLVIAHRGDSTHAPENTLRAIDLAFRSGADAVEVDVRLSRDGVPVILHDDVLDHTTDGSGPAAALTLAELKQLDAGSWMDDRFRFERIPTLEEALATARGRGRLLIDVKADAMAPLVAKIYRRLGVPAAEAIIGAWSTEQVNEFVQCMPGAQILRSHGTFSDWNPGYFEWLKTLGVKGIELGEPWPPGLVAAVRSLGLLLICYTVNDEGTMQRLLRIGVDGIETDNPDLAVRVCLGGAL